MSQISFDRFDGVAAWDLCTPAEQRALGAMFMELIAARHIQHGVDCEPTERAAAAAERLIISGIGEVLGEHYDDLRVDDQGRYRLPSSLGLVCHSCGCSQQDPCEEGCGWHDA